MSRRNKKRRPPAVKAATASHRCTATESAARTNQVYDWILEGVPSHEIVQRCAESWKIAERQARTYIAKAGDLLQAEMDKRASTALEAHLTARWHLYKRTCEARDFKTAATILRDIGRLECLYASDRSLLAKAGLDESLTQRMAEADQQAADVLRDVYKPSN